MINYEHQINKFLSITQAVKITANAQCLYFQLLNFFRLKFFPESLNIDNISMHNVTRLSRQQMTNARHELQNLALIKYENGLGSASGKYTLIDLTNAKLGSILEISNQKEKPQDLADLKATIECLDGENFIWANYILEAINKAISQNKNGVYNNYYATSQTFLQAENNLKFSTINKLITVLKNKPNIADKEAYILTVIANSVKKKKQVASATK